MAETPTARTLRFKRFTIDAGRDRVSWLFGINANRTARYPDGEAYAAWQVTFGFASLWVQVCGLEPSDG